MKVKYRIVVMEGFKTTKWNYVQKKSALKKLDSLLKDCTFSNDSVSMVISTSQCPHGNVSLSEWVTTHLSRCAECDGAS
jgi:hypothetical protein